MNSELSIKNGRVIDPANGVDKKCETQLLVSWLRLLFEYIFSIIAMRATATDNSVCLERDYVPVQIAFGGVRYMQVVMLNRPAVCRST